MLRRSIQRGIAARIAPNVASVAMALAVLGCASSAERAARDDWQRMAEPSPQPPEPAPATDGRSTLPDLAQSATLEDLMRYAMAHNPGLGAAHNAWRAALERIPQARSLPDPQFSYAYAIEEVETRVGPQRQKFGLTQAIPLAKLGLRGEIELENAYAAAAHHEAASRRLRFRIAQHWYDYYYLARAIAITEENLTLVDLLENVARNQYATGRAPYSAVIKAQVELGKLEDQLLSLRDQRAPHVARLNAELGRSATAAIAWPTEVGDEVLALDIDGLRAALLEHNPELVASAHATARSRAAADLAGRNTVPDLVLGAEYIDTGEARVAGVPDSGKDPVIAKAAINLPIWWGKNRAQKDEAEARHRAAIDERRRFQQDLLAELELAHFQYEDAERKVDLYAHSLIPRARQALEVMEEAFTTGKADFLDLVDAQRTLLEFELLHERARADRAAHLAELEMLAGVDLAAKAARSQEY